MIDNQDMERLREIFVTRREFGINKDELEKAINRDDKRLAVIESQLKMIIWLLCACGGGIITMIIKMFFGG